MATQERIAIVGDKSASFGELENPEWRREKLLEILTDKKLIPQDPIDQKYLLEVHNYRCLCEETGNDSPLKEFPKSYKIDPTRVKRLNRQLGIIHTKTPLSNPRINYDVIVYNGNLVPGEVEEYYSPKNNEE